MMVTLTHAGSGLKMQINAARIAALVPVGALGDDANRPKSTKCLVVLDMPNQSYWVRETVQIVSSLIDEVTLKALGVKP